MTESTEQRVAVSPPTGVEKEWRPVVGDAMIQRLREAVAAQTGVYPTIEAAETILDAALSAGEGI